MSCFPCVYPNKSLSCTLLDPGEPLFLSFLLFLRPEGLEAGSSTGSWSRRRNTNISPSRTGWREGGGGQCVYVSTHVVYVSEMRTHPNVPFTETCVHVSIRKTCMPFILSCWLVMLPGFIHVAYNFMSIKDGASAHQLRGQWLRCAAECGSTRRKGWQRVSGGRTAGLDTPPSPARIACLVGAPPLPHWRNIQYTTVTHTALKEKC